MYFNPRSGERSDVIVPSGSTICWDFNPRSGERSDATEKYQYLEESVFQSTLRRTERPFHGNIALAKNNFNPRSGERSDRLRSCVISSLSISIHAPANGATACGAALYPHYLFQSTLRRTERRSISWLMTGTSVFQSTLRRTERPLDAEGHPTYVEFQSTLRRTERLQFCTKKFKKLYKTA